MQNKLFKTLLIGAFILQGLSFGAEATSTKAGSGCGRYYFDVNNPNNAGQTAAMANGTECHCGTLNCYGCRHPRRCSGSM